jgi:hypothetical protein
LSSSFSLWLAANLITGSLAPPVGPTLQTLESPHLAARRPTFHFHAQMQQELQN